MLLFFLVFLRLYLRQYARRKGRINCIIEVGMGPLIIGGLQGADD